MTRSACKYHRDSPISGAEQTVDSVRHDSTSESTLTGPSSLEATVHRAANHILARIPSVTSISATIKSTSSTLVDAESVASNRSDASRPSTSSGTRREVLRDCATLCFYFLYMIGVPQGLHNAFNSLVGYAILHLTRPDDAAYGVSVVTAALTGLVGAVTFNAIIWGPVVLMILLAILWCAIHACVRALISPPPPPRSPSPSLPSPPLAPLPPARPLGDPLTPSPQDWYDDPEKRENSPVRTQIWGAFPLWWSLPLCAARATAMGALGAALLKHSAFLPMSARHAAITNVVGATVLYVPRGAVAVVWRVLLVREYHAFQVRLGCKKPRLVSWCRGCNE
ncbi:hypothetical protein L227DRAFT_420915 [Lentinus tigrinus ALCF2SS1-6]|uniref:Uncharacterized protein n=1 Tax=Lentinus tigrinus ALCF2SS1-6 TaxID=1328759 RepID=A0A5C2RPR6_9APHY|nr:hypothetical protein L227DRAFT_420915 [Lentinus tigrinus ALCF2SS1-6]